MIPTVGGCRSVGPGVFIALVLVLGSMPLWASGGDSTSSVESAGASEGGTPEPSASPGTSPPEGEGLSLAAKMRSLIEESGGDTVEVNSSLMSFYGEGLSDYEVDEAAVIALGREYLEAGDDTMAEIVFNFLQMAAYQVTGGVSADLWAAQGDVSLARGDTSNAKDMFEVALNTDPGHAYSKERLASLGDAATPEPSPQGTPPAAAPRKNRLSIGRRDDLARFRFRYADDSGRELWVSETCYNSGVLRAVAQWGEAEPWVFESVSETTFEQANAASGEKPVRLEFQVHPGHGGVEAVVASGGAEGRFEEAGYLPDGFEPEMGTCD